MFTSPLASAVKVLLPVPPPLHVKVTDSPGAKPPAETPISRNCGPLDAGTSKALTVTGPVAGAGGDVVGAGAGAVVRVGAGAAELGDGAPALGVADGVALGVADGAGCCPLPNTNDTSSPVCGSRIWNVPTGCGSGWMTVTCVGSNPSHEVPVYRGVPCTGSGEMIGLPQ